MVIYLCLFLLCLFSYDISALDSSSPTNETPFKLSAPLAGEDGMMYSCSERKFLAFHGNGTIAWSLLLGFSCRKDVPPTVDGSGKIYLVAEDRVLKITPPNIFTQKSSSEIIFGPDSKFGGSGEIVGIGVSIWSSAIFINVNRRGIFAFNLGGQFLWSAGPMLYRFSYPQGCKGNVTDCYFNSPPAIDQCEGTLFISTNEGQLYSLYTRSPNFKWIRDFSNIDKSFFITPGNNGRLYVTFPNLTLLVTLDISTGEIIWKNDFGPLSSENMTPIVDSNGWVSIGSLDGYLYTFSPSGVLTKHLKATAINSVIQISPVIDSSGFAVYVWQTRMNEKLGHFNGEHTYISAMEPLGIVLTLLVPATGAVFWTENYHENAVASMLSKSDLRHFQHDGQILLTFLASSGIKKFTPSYSRREKLRWTCSHAKSKYPYIYTTSREWATLLFFLLQFSIIMVLALLVRFCCVFWRKRKVQQQNLGKFFKKRRSLHMKRKNCGRIISELEQKASEDASGSLVLLDQLGDAIRRKEAIERKLSASYSLGRDKSPRSRSRSLLPLYNGKTKSYSFHSANTENVTIFNTLSDSTTEEDIERSESEVSFDSSSSSSSNIRNGKIEVQSHVLEDTRSALKGKAPMEDAGSFKTKWEDGWSVAANPLYSEPQFEGSNLESNKSGKVSYMQEKTNQKTSFLKRRTLSSAN